MRFIQTSVVTGLAGAEALQDVVILGVSQLFSSPLASSQPSCSTATKKPNEAFCTVTIGKQGL